MTFYELEKICKAKRRFYILILFVIIVLIIIAIVMSYKFLKKEVNSKKEIKVEKIIKNEVKTVPQEIPPKTHIKKLQDVKKKATLEFILPDFDDLEVKKVSKKLKIDKKSNQEKNNTVLNNKILETKTIPSFETCINLAKKYLKEKNYKEALKWAKFANIQNKKDPESWIITAKVLYALGKKQKAIKILKIYDNYYKNSKVQKLIKEFNEK